jgi:DNA-directed RNA polymerase II subunit RPB1
MNAAPAHSMECVAEVKEIMGVSNCLLTPQSNKPTMGMVQDALLMSRIFTNRDTFVTRDQMMQIIGFVNNWDGNIPIPCILKPKQLWSGKQLFSIVLPKLNHYGYTSFHPDYEDMSPFDVKSFLKMQWEKTTSTVISSNEEDLLLLCTDTSSKE